MSDRVKVFHINLGHVSFSGWGKTWIARISIPCEDTPPALSVRMFGAHVVGVNSLLTSLVQREFV